MATFLSIIILCTLYSFSFSFQIRRLIHKVGFKPDANNNLCIELLLIDFVHFCLIALK